MIFAIWLGDIFYRLDVQRPIVAYLDSLRERVNELRQLQAESQMELSALKELLNTIAY